MNAKFLLRKYLNTGTGIPEYQFNKLNTNLRTTYIRKRSIDIESGLNVQTFEVPYISQDTWIKSLEKNGSNIRYIKNQTPELQMVAVEKEPRYIRHIKNPTPEVQMYAVEDNPSNIFDIENPTPQVQMYVVKKNPFYVHYIQNPTDDVQDYILKNHKKYIFHIKNPNDKIKPLLDLEEYQMYAVKINPFYIKDIKNPTPQVQDYILDNRPEYVKFIKNPNEKIKQYKLNNNINESRMKILVNEEDLNYIKESINSGEVLKEDLRRWFKEKWVDVSKKVNGKYPPCGRKDADGKSYPKCRPSKKISKETPKIASSYNKKEKAAMTQQKRRAERNNPKIGKGNKPTMTHYNEQQNVDERSRSFAFTRKKRKFSQPERMSNSQRYREVDRLSENEQTKKRKIFNFFDLSDKGIIWVVEPHDNGKRVKPKWEHESNLITLWNINHPAPGQEWVKQAIHFPKNDSLKWWNENGQFQLVDDKYNQIIRSIKLYKKQNEKELNKSVKIKKVICNNCGWKWDLKDGGDDPYVCHKCHNDNSKKYKHTKITITEQQLKLLIENQINENLIYEDEYGSVQSTDFIVDDLLNEAEYKGRKVKLGKIMQGDIKKFKVYVKNEKGKVVKVNFGFGGKSAKGKRMVIKKNNPVRRKSFRARMNCDNPGPIWKPRFWACRAW
jgi:hypothetical protein